MTGLQINYINIIFMPNYAPSLGERGQLGLDILKDTK